jgi:hypothetical protein
MIERTMDRFDLYPARLAGDTGYGSAEMLNWLVYEHGIEPHVPVFDKSARTDGTFARDDFTYDHQGDVYFCPGDKMLTCKGTLVNDGATLLYRASKYDCDVCSLKQRCCPNAPARKVPRSIYEGERDMARDIAKSAEGRTSRRQRKKVRDALRASQTHSPARPAPTTRTEWCSRRIPPRRHCTKPQEARQTYPNAAAETGVTRTKRKAPNFEGTPRLVNPNPFFNRIGAELPPAGIE